MRAYFWRAKWTNFWSRAGVQSGVQGGGEAVVAEGILVPKFGLGDCSVAVVELRC